MKFASSSFVFSLVTIISISSCTDNYDDTILYGKWLASSVERKDCDNELLNGVVNCDENVGSGNTYSCVEFDFNQSGYALSATFDSNRNNEVGTYEPSEGQIKLCPTQPAGACYILPITASDNNAMTVELPLADGCIAIIPLINT